LAILGESREGECSERKGGRVGECSFMKLLRGIPEVQRGEKVQEIGEAEHKMAL